MELAMISVLTILCVCGPQQRSQFIQMGILFSLSNYAYKVLRSIIIMNITSNTHNWQANTFLCMGNNGHNARKEMKSNKRNTNTQKLIVTRNHKLGKYFCICIFFCSCMDTKLYTKFWCVVENCFSCHVCGLSFPLQPPKSHLLLKTILV